MWLIPFAPFSFAPFFALLFESPAAPSPALRPAEARVSILLYDALDFSTDRDDGGGQTRESLSRVASASAAVTGLDPVRFAHQVRRSRQVLPVGEGRLFAERKSGTRIYGVA
jgi:hypothetical protein